MQKEPMPSEHTEADIRRIWQFAREIEHENDFADEEVGDEETESD
jgi:hypothetical protein